MPPEVVRVNLEDGPIGTLVDMLVAHEDNAEHEESLRKVQAAYDAAVQEVRDAKRSEELTRLGKTAAVKRHVRRGLSALEPYREKVERLEGAIAKMRRKALERPAGERSVEAIAMEREIRDRLMEEGADPLEVSARYHSALRNGDDTFVSAVENAPAAYPLIDAETRRKGHEYRIQQSEQADEIAALEVRRNVIRSVVNTAETQLVTLAERNGVNRYDLGGDDEPETV